MDKFGLYVPQLLPFKEHFLPHAHRACMGCGVALGVRHMYKALEEKSGSLENASWEIPWTQLLPGSIAKSQKDAKRDSRPTLLRIEKEGSSSLLICFDNEATEGKPSLSVLMMRVCPSI